MRRPPKSGVRSLSRRLVIVPAVAAVLIAAAFAARAVWPRPARSATGVALGTLPGGVARDRLNLVLVTLDTTRADHMGAYGNREIETPSFDRIAHEGVRFAQAESVAPLTLVAHSSMFTGKFPPEHGVRDNGGFFLGSDQVTLAEVLKAHGYRTGGFIGAYVLDSKWGINQGFDTYFDNFDLSESRAVSMAAIRRPGNEVVDHATQWIEQVKGAPFFAWVHLYDAHAPYRPPEPYATTYKDHPYNGGIAFADSQVGRVLSTLQALGLYDRTVVMILGDHGESLGDHGEAAHGFFIYDSTTHVPFAIRTPFSATRQRVVQDPVRSVDVMPTALDLLGIAVPTGIAGRSLVPLMTGAVNTLDLDAYSEAMYPLYHYGWSDLRALRSGRYKVIDAPRPELYDIDRDPQETTNIYGQRRDVADRMLTHLRAMEAGFRTTDASQSQAQVDPEARERLAALGYVGSFVATESDRRTDRADPKDKIDIFNALGEATELARSTAPDDHAAFAHVLALIDQILAKDPGVIDAWFMKGTQYLTHGQPDKAVEYLKHTLALKPDYDLAVFNLAQAYRDMGDDDAALAGYEHYLTLDAKDPYVYYLMGEIWLDRGPSGKAEALFKKALQIDPRVAAAKNALGVLALERGDPATAERLIRDAIAIKPDVRLAHFNLGLLAEQRGDLPGAEREYYAELKAHPDAYKAAFNMSRLYEKVGDHEGEIGALKQSVESDPKFAEGYIYLAKAYLDAGTNFDAAVRMAQKGLELDPHSPDAPLAHYVMADIFNREGRMQDSAREAALGRALEARNAGRGTRGAGGGVR